MSQITQWRGFDLRKRYARIRRAFDIAEVTSPNDVPIIVNTPCYFPFGAADVPEDYYVNPAAMVGYQADGYERHLACVNDDAVPYFMPWFGTGVLASGFGCPTNWPIGPSEDLVATDVCVNTPAGIARLKNPDPYHDGLMPRVLDAIDYARDNSDLPVGLTDMNSPLSTVAQMCGYDKLFLWMHDDPAMIHGLFSLVAEAFIEWVKVQKKHIGEPLDSSNGLQGVWSPKGVGIWVSDDDMMTLGPELYRQFVVPSLSRIFQTFGGGSVHFCGNGYHQIENILQIENVRVVNHSPMGDFEGFGEAMKLLSGKLTIQLQDCAPIDQVGYYTQLYDKIRDWRGVMVAMFVLDTLGMNNRGTYTSVDWKPFEVANCIVQITREAVSRTIAAR